MYRAGIGHQRPFYARDLRSAVKRASIAKACIFSVEKIFIPFQVVTRDRVQFNIGNPIEIVDILYGSAGIGDILNRQNLNADNWMFGMKERTLFSIRIKNRIFKENSNDLNIDFILHFGRYIKKKAWSKENFEETIKDIDLDVYHVLLLDGFFFWLGFTKPG